MTNLVDLVDVNHVIVTAGIAERVSKGYGVKIARKDAAPIA